MKPVSGKGRRAEWSAGVWECGSAGVRECESARLGGGWPLLAHSRTRALPVCFQLVIVITTLALIALVLTTNMQPRRRR
jgi:hypothetical protein